MTLTKPRKIALGIAVGVLALCGLGAIVSSGDEPTTPANAADVVATTTATDSAATATAAAPVNTTAVTAAASSVALTVAQQNAVRSAKSYLNLKGFSRSGLIKQLEYEGFATADATAAVDSINVDWMAQAARAAKSYMDLKGFSRSGLIKQLEYEGFTPEQAAHGADSVGL